MKITLLALVLLFCCSLSFSQSHMHMCNDTTATTVEVVEVFVYDMAGRLVTENIVNYNDGVNLAIDLCLPNGIYIIVVPRKKKTFKVGLIW